MPLRWALSGLDGSELLLDDLSQALPPIVEGRRQHGTEVPQRNRFEFAQNSLEVRAELCRRLISVIGVYRESA